MLFIVAIVAPLFFGLIILQPVWADNCFHVGASAFVCLTVVFLTCTILELCSPLLKAFLGYLLARNKYEAVCLGALDKSKRSFASMV